MTDEFRKDIMDASHVLDYWFAIEFLGQESYQSCTDELKLTKKLVKFKKSDKKTQNDRKQIQIFEKLDSDNDIYKVIRKQADECGMSTWGNLTFYVGKIRRQVCIERLASECGIHIEQAEKDTDYIPLLSFQCNDQGKYIEHTLSLSTPVWALSQLSGKGIAQISKLLSGKAYLETIEILEKRYFSVDYASLTSNQEENPNLEENEFTPKFDLEAITIKKIFEIHNDLVSTFGKYVGKDAIVINNGLKYQLFKNLESKEKYDDDNYLGLCHDFYSPDIKMVKEYLEKEDHISDHKMLKDLVSYIRSPDKDYIKSEKFDFVSPNDKDKYLVVMSEILNMKNAPIAKWPSRYMPALMQQVAINFAISNNSKGIFKQNGCIFSVNGPPGTGKTTLLKEIVANSIVEKAILLSGYDRPDNAFKEIRFTGGIYKGAYVPPNPGNKYSFYPSWFKFKDDKITDFGILVASCNNSAVENITKELPLESGILDNLKAITAGESPDSKDMQEQLMEIHKLFSTKETENKIEIYEEKDKGEKRLVEYPEIYFTHYAQELFGSSDKDSDAWGLVAAPLGKKNNLKDYYYKVLNPLWQDFLIKNESIVDRIPQYQRSREKFLEQLNVVCNLQDKLKQYGEVTLNEINARINSKNIKNNNTLVIDDKQTNINIIEGEVENTRKQIEIDGNNLENADRVCLEIEKTINGLQNDKKKLAEQELMYRKNAIDQENSVCILTKIFRRSKYTAVLELAQLYRNQADACIQNSSEITKKIEAEQEEYKNAIKEKTMILNHLNTTHEQLRDLEEKKEKVSDEINKLRKEIDDAEVSAHTAKYLKDSVLNEYISGGELKTGQILDDTFIERILSEDGKISTEAQTVNPWTTEEYNREREKLFYCALQMTKDFILSSKACRRNLAVLGQYWGYKTETGVGRIDFKPEDKDKMIISLFNTMFLLTPVVSSTFASIGQLLKDIKEPGSIGTLIVDEAGQAQPQMAVGAIFRSRKCIIVGDPKQVEPVVTDDLKLLKDAFTDPIYANYKNKSLSVQSCADALNPFGTFFENGTESPEWVGCPLLVHRRCISPMYDISNKISYNGIMKQKTLPPSAKKSSGFILSKSQWINIDGIENGGGNHFVQRQGEMICHMLNIAFGKSSYPDLYIISPFTSVVNGIHNLLRRSDYRKRFPYLEKSSVLDDWLNSNMGTVHKFQGKEANEVIFALGCDKSVKTKYAVTNFVNSNIVNVAVTRAKYRLYIVGDFNVWCSNQFVREAKSIIDKLTIKNTVETESWEGPGVKNN